MKQVYNPGCALLIYKPEYASRILKILNDELHEIEMHTVCCRHAPGISNTEIINTCAGCDRRFGSLYDGITTISLWQILAESKTFLFPDYNGLTMTIHDACPVRTKSEVHKAIRTLLTKMNINVIEAEYNCAKSVCCGDDLYPKLPVEQVHKKMKERADSMPCQEVCVYCVSCIKSMHIGGKTPRYILDLLFKQPTTAGIYDTVEWHKQLDDFIEEH